MPKVKIRYIFVIVFISLIAGLISLQLIEKNTGNFRRQEKQNSGPDSRPSEWAWQQRTFPHGTADKRAIVDALQQAQEIRKTKKDRRGSNNVLEETLRDVPWEFAGPENIGGRVTDIEYDPQNPSIVYAGAATGGVFKSYDSGWNWEPVFDDQAALSIGDIAVDPVDPSIIYVGTGEANGGHNNHPGGGVYRSTDSGATWELMGLEETVSIGRIVIDPQNTNRVFVAAVGSYFGPDPDRGVYRSDNSGVTWDKVLFVTDSTGAIDIVINPQNPSLLLSAMWERVRGPHTSHLYGPTSGIYRTTDGGDNWTRLGLVNGLPEEEENIARIGLAICKEQPNILYALYIDNSYGYTYNACYKSINSGENWIKIDTNRELEQGFGTFSWYFGNIRVHPTDPQKIFVLDVAFMRSVDGGDSWPISYGYGNQFHDFHVDHHALAFHPFHPDTIIDGNDGGINISYDGGESWTKTGPLPVTQFYEMTIDQTNPDRLYGGTQDNGTLRTMTGAVNDWEAIYGGDGFYAVVDHTDPEIIYAESQWGNLGKSVDGGNIFSYALNGVNGAEPTNWNTPVVMDPNDHLTLYYGTDRVYRTVDGAELWHEFSPDLTKQLENSRLGTVTTIATANSDSNVVYAGTDDGNVWVTSDSVPDWRNINTENLPYRWITRVTVDPTDANIAYLTFSGYKWRDPEPHVFRTENMGESWQDISGNLPDAPVNDIVVDPFYPHVLYIGCDVGCYFSVNSGLSWEELGQGLPIVPVYSLDIHRELRFLAVGTHGRSMYKMRLDDIVPVELVDFFAKVSNSYVTLEWQVATETNNYGFHVERKFAGSDFKQIGFVKGAGTTSESIQYYFKEKDLNVGHYYYRLKQVDLDGKFTYSGIVDAVISNPGEFMLSQNFPNPFNASTAIEFSLPKAERVEVAIFNAKGQRVKVLVNEERLPGKYRVIWNGKNVLGKIQ